MQQHSTTISLNLVVGHDSQVFCLADFGHLVEFYSSYFCALGLALDWLLPWLVDHFDFIYCLLYCMDFFFFRMEKFNVSQLIHLKLDGHNYVLWAQTMCNFIKGRRLWHYIIATIVQPVQKEDEDAEKFVDRLQEWDNRNHQIITWFYNTSQLSIQLQFSRFEQPNRFVTFLLTVILP